MADMLATERTLSRDIVPVVERAVPGVEVLAVELLSPSRFCVYVDHAEGVDHALCARVTEILSRLPRRRTRSTSRRPGLDRPLRRPAHFRAAIGQRRPDSHRRRDRRQEALSRHGRRRVRPERPDRRRRDGARHPVRDDRAGQPDRRGIGERHEPGDHGRHPHDRAREGHRDGNARRGARGRAPRCVQEDAGCLPPRRGDPRRRGRVPRLLDRDPGRPRGAARRRGARGGDRRARAHRGGDRRAPAHARQRRRPRARLVAGARGPDGARGRDARTASAASPR